MNGFVIQKSLIGALLVLATLFINGCGESTNIQGNNNGVVTSCSSLLGVSCVTGRLIDDAAYNINYECDSSAGGKVKSVTASDGSFSCPNGSKVTFSLDNAGLPAALTHIAALEPVGLTINPPSLEDLFLSHYKSTDGEVSGR